MGVLLLIDWSRSITSTGFASAARACGSPHRRSQAARVAQSHCTLRPSRTMMSATLPSVEAASPDSRGDAGSCRERTLRKKSAMCCSYGTPVRGLVCSSGLVWRWISSGLIWTPNRDAGSPRYCRDRRGPSPDRPRSGSPPCWDGRCWKSHLQAALITELDLPGDAGVGHAPFGKDALSVQLERLPCDFRAAPLGDVEMVYAPIADEAGAVVRDHVHRQPFAPLRVEGDQPCRPRPHVVVESGGDRRRRLRRVACSAGHTHLDRVDLAEIAVAGQLAGVAEVRIAPLLGAGLEHAAVAAAPASRTASPRQSSA